MQRRFKREGSSERFIPPITLKNIFFLQSRHWEAILKEFFWFCFVVTQTSRKTGKSLLSSAGRYVFPKSNINPIFTSLASSDLALAMTRRNVFSPVPSP